MKKVSTIFIILTLGTIIFAGCTNKNEVTSEDTIVESKKTEFVVETDYEFHAKIGDWYKRDIAMPKVADSVTNGNIINEELKSAYYPNSKEGWEQELEVGQLLPEYTETGVYETNYCVSNMHGICSLNIIGTFTGTTHTVLKGNEFVHQDKIVEWTRLELLSFYYNENTGNVITKEEFLHDIDYTEDDILKAFKEKYGSQYDKYEYGVKDILFWFDDNNKLQVNDSNVKVLAPTK